MARKQKTTVLNGRGGRMRGGRSVGDVSLKNERSDQGVRKTLRRGDAIEKWPGCLLGDAKARTRRSALSAQEQSSGEMRVGEEE